MKSKETYISSLISMGCSVKVCKWVIKVIKKVNSVMFEFCIAFKMCTNVEKNNDNFETWRK